MVTGGTAVFWSATTVTACRWVLKPTKEKTSVWAPAGTFWMENVPSEFVELPMLVPSTTTVTPGRPCFCSSSTRPLTEPVWAKALVKPTQVKSRRNHSFTK